MSKRETIREVYERQIAEMELTNRTLQAQVHRRVDQMRVAGVTSPTLGSSGFSCQTGNRSLSGQQATNYPLLSVFR